MRPPASTRGEASAPFPAARSQRRTSENVRDGRDRRDVDAQLVVDAVEVARYENHHPGCANKLRNMGFIGSLVITVTAIVLVIATGMPSWLVLVALAAFVIRVATLPYQPPR